MLDRAKRAATEGLDCSSGMITRLELCVMPNLWSDGDACNLTHATVIQHSQVGTVVIQSTVLIVNGNENFRWIPQSLHWSSSSHQCIVDSVPWLTIRGLSWLI